MANEAHLNLVRRGKDDWNRWKERNPFERSDLRGANFEGFNFDGFNLNNADLRQMIIRGATFIDSNLGNADFKDSDASSGNFKDAILTGANLSNVNLSRANFYRANLVDVNLTGSNLFSANFRQSKFNGTILADVDLETALGLDEVNHLGHSSMSVDAVYNSGGHLPRKFLEGIGLPEVFIDYVPSLVESYTGITFHSCFISYSHQDEAFASRLWASLRERRIRVWYAPEEMQGGKKLFDQIDRAISLHDKLLLVLSENSMKSDWVETEIRKALRNEKESGKRKIFPIRLVDMDTIKSWTCFDADSGRDLAVDIRSYYIPDFSNWLNQIKFSEEFGKLCRDLQTKSLPRFA